MSCLMFFPLSPVIHYPFIFQSDQLHEELLQGPDRVLDFFGEVKLMKKLTKKELEGMSHAMFAPEEVTYLVYSNRGLSFPPLPDPALLPLSLTPGYNLWLG